MQREEKIPMESVEKIIEAIYEGGPSVFEAYSEFESDVREFPTKESLEQYVFEQLESNHRHKFVYCSLFYPEMGGLIRKRRVDLDPKHCEGATFRYATEGWGLIGFQLKISEPEDISCTFVVNSEKRANNWFDTIPELGSPSAWNWKMVERHARRLIQVLKKSAKPRLAGNST